MKRLTLDDIRIAVTIWPQVTRLKMAIAPAVVNFLSLAAPRIQGRIRGPFCSRSQTLAANYTLRGIPKEFAAVAQIPDFCHWSSDVPFTYEIDFEVRDGEQLIASLQETIAISWVTAHQGKLYRSAKRWIPRIARLWPTANEEQATESEFTDWLEAVWLQDLALLVSAEQVNDSLLEACQKIGVPLAIELNGELPEGWSPWESSGCVFLLLNKNGRREALDTTLLVASPVESSSTVPFTTWEIRRGDRAIHAPAFLVEQKSVVSSPADARSACDLLQAATASQRDWSAFIV